MEYSKAELKDAAEFRAQIHREALAELRQIDPDIDSVVDRRPVEAYFQQRWDYPGAWYTVVAVPEDAGGRSALVAAIVRDTLAQHRPKEQVQPQPKREFVIPGGYRCPDDPFYTLIKEYPECVVDYGIVEAPSAAAGIEAHRCALARACSKLQHDGDIMWDFNVAGAVGQMIPADDLFSTDPRDGTLHYRRAFLHPPHQNDYTAADFDKINRALFPNGTDKLEVCEWTTDWSDYFDEGHEWWGALCCTVYDKSLGRFVVIMASATD